MSEEQGINPAQKLKPKHELGVLFVHGIGDQKQGETLNEFGTPIIKWIDQWLQEDLHINRLVGNLAQHISTKDFNGSARFDRSMLQPPDLPLDTPSHATATIVKQVGVKEVCRQSWLLAESWWSPQTLAPSISPFLLWLITRGPWVLLLHLSQCVRLDYKQMAYLMGQIDPNDRTGTETAAIWWDITKFLVVTTVWLLLSLLLILLWSIVSLVALVPFGFVRKRVYELLLAITGVVGDSYVLINEPIQRVAFATTTRRALMWLHAQGCKKIAVVAHSQGAAIARDVLSERGAPRANCFITFGPGIIKLDALIDREQQAPQDFLWCGAAAPLTLLAVLTWIRLDVGGHAGFALWGFPLCASALAFTAIMRSWNSTAETLGRLISADLSKLDLMPLYQPRMHWKDFFSSHDPVPNGPLSTAVSPDPRRVISQKVTVLASFLKDHTAYWTSRADFVPRVTEALDKCAGTGIFQTSTGMQRVQTTRTYFERCVNLLQFLRWAGLAALLIPLYVFGRVLAAGKSLTGWLQGFGLGSINAPISGLESAISWLGEKAVGQASLGPPMVDFLLLAVVTVTTLHVWGRIVAYWWGHMSALSLAPAFVPSASTRALVSQILLGVLVLALGLLPLALSVAWTFAPDSITWSNLDAFLTWFAKITVAALYVTAFVAAVLGTLEFIPQLKAAFAPSASRKGVLKREPAIWQLPIFWLIFLTGGFWLLSVWI